MKMLKKIKTDMWINVFIQCVVKPLASAMGI